MNRTPNFLHERVDRLSRRRKLPGRRLRQYLKMTIEFCKEHGLIDVPITVARAGAWELPFDLASIPVDYPPVPTLRKFAVPLAEPSL